MDSSVTSTAASTAKRRAQPRRGQPRRHVGELELHGLVLADRLAERGALLRVPQRRLERRLADAHGDGAEAQIHDGEEPGRR
jgi:hypothetical protein